MVIVLCTTQPTTLLLAQGGAEGTGAELVKCGRIAGTTGGSVEECGFNDLIALVGDVIRFVIFNIITPLMVIGLVYFGARMVIMKDKSKEVAKIKNGLWSMVIGIFFMLTAWLLVKAITTGFGVKFSKDPTTGVMQFLK